MMGSDIPQVKGDVRMIYSRVFTASHSLRFPRVTAIRWDKGLRDCYTHKELQDDVERKRNGGAYIFVLVRRGLHPLPDGSLE